MKVRLNLLGVIRVISVCKDTGENEVNFSGITVGDLVKQLLPRMKPEEKQLFLNEQGELQPDLLVLVNGRFTGAADPFSQPLAEGDLIELALPPA